MAILIGDLAHVYADQLVPRRSPDGAGACGTSCASSSTSASTSTWSAPPAATSTSPRARRIARYKSGKYTIERPLHVGAALAGRLADLAGPLSAYGDPLGEAFQLRDDLLGVFGDEALTGKPVGDDLREGKPTPLLARHRGRCPPAPAWRCSSGSARPT